LKPENNGKSNCSNHQLNNEDSKVQFKAAVMASSEACGGEFIVMGNMVMLGGGPMSKRKKADTTARGAAPPGWMEKGMLDGGGGSGVQARHVAAACGGGGGKGCGAHSELEEIFHFSSDPPSFRFLHSYLADVRVCCSSQCVQEVCCVSCCSMFQYASVMAMTLILLKEQRQLWHHLHLLHLHILLRDQVETWLLLTI
jgi:hypothetical protein